MPAFKCEFCLFQNNLCATTYRCDWFALNRTRQSRWRVQGMRSLKWCCAHAIWQRYCIRRHCCDHRKSSETFCPCLVANGDRTLSSKRLKNVDRKRTETVISASELARYQFEMTNELGYVKPKTAAYENVASRYWIRGILEFIEINNGMIAETAFCTTTAVTDRYHAAAKK